jgi:pimeloyl-ACP methyl ester carboxylesterase
VSPRRALTAALAIACATGLAACELPSSKRTAAPTSVPTEATKPPPGTTGLEKFYEQSLKWSSCTGGQCAWLTVPVDYAKPDGDTLRLALLKAPATGTRMGSLVFNPGGPGAPGTEYARAADQFVTRAVRRAYDFVGFDPRGVGRSAPIDCVTDADLDTFLGVDPTPDDPAEVRSFADEAKAFAESCGAKAGALLRHVSTVDVAKDLDVLRAALGETKLTYLGKSYGTFIGSTYAGLFPKKVGRFVLDGVVPPELTAEQLNLGQAEGFERATRAWAASCVEGGDCPLGADVEQVMTGLRDLLSSLDQTPLTRTGDARVTQLGEGWASYGVAFAMYDQRSWSQLDDALRAVVDEQDGSGLMKLANRYADRTATGRYTDNLMEVIYAVNCLDRPDTDSLTEHQKAAEESLAKAPTWGPYLLWSSLPCGFWPVKATNPPHKITAEGSGLIVVVGTTRDPATPYEWSVMLNEELANSTLITWNGDGHTAYVRSKSACVNNAIDAYYLKGTPPPADLRC